MLRSVNMFILNEYDDEANSLTYLSGPGLLWPVDNHDGDVARQ